MDKFIKLSSVLMAVLGLSACGPSPDEMKQMYYQGEHNGRAVYQFPVSVAITIWTRQDGPYVQRQRKKLTDLMAKPLCPNGYEVVNMRDLGKRDNVSGVAPIGGIMVPQRHISANTLMTIECNA